MWGPNPEVENHWHRNLNISPVNLEITLQSECPCCLWGITGSMGEDISGVSIWTAPLLFYNDSGIELSVYTPYLQWG